jgi:hypothetical protein
MKRALPHESPTSGTYEVVDRLTKIRVASTTFEGLVKNVSRTRIALGAVSGSDIRTEVENWVCEEHPEDCSDVDMNIPRKRHMTLSDVLRGTRVMIEFKLAGSPLVDRTEAERRGAICKECQFNQRFDKPCTGWCPELSSMVNSIVGHQGTYYDQFLHGCGICGCFLPAAIWLPLSVQCFGINESMKNQFKAISNCWKNCDQAKS